jgi:hypothetical protein
MSNEKQTSVEWYHQQIVDRQNGNGDSRSLDEILEQAKAMEKEQIVKAANFDSKSISENGYRKGEQYYNETYGGNK